MPTTLKANLIFTNLGWPKLGNGQGHTALIVVRDVNGGHMAKESSLSIDTNIKEGAWGIEKSNWGVEKFEGKI